MSHADSPPPPGRAPEAAAHTQWRFPNRATPPGSTAYYSVRLAPFARRDALAALFGWRGELRRILAEVSDPGVARLKLDWWRDELQRMHAQTPRHPLGQLLAPVIRDQQLPAAPFQEMAGQVEAALRAHYSPDQPAWTAAAEADLGALFELLGRCLGLSAAAPLAQARRCGGWCARVRWLRDGGLLLRRGHPVLPLDQLQAAGLDVATLTAPDGRARLPALLSPLAATLAAEQPTPAALADLPRVLRAQVRIHAGLLQELRRSGLDVVDQRIALTPLRKLWLAWRC